jgi:hypothetical protein
VFRYVIENKVVDGWRWRSGWANLSRARGHGTSCPEVQSRNRRRHDGLRISRGYHERRSSRWNPVQRRFKNAEEGLARCCLGCETGLRHSRHCGQQTLGIFVTWVGENLLGIAGLYDLALMKNGNPVANSSDRGKIM